MIFIEIAFGWFLLSIFFMMFMGFSIMLEPNNDKAFSKVKIFIIGIITSFTISFILMILLIVLTNDQENKLALGLMMTGSFAFVL